MVGGKRSDYVAEKMDDRGHEIRACVGCRLVKTYDQFREWGCENCPFFDMEKEHDNVVNCTTPNFTGGYCWDEPAYGHNRTPGCFS